MTLQKFLFAPIDDSNWKSCIPASQPESNMGFQVVAYVNGERKVLDLKSGKNIYGQQVSYGTVTKITDANDDQLHNRKFADLSGISGGTEIYIELVNYDQAKAGGEVEIYARSNAYTYSGSATTFGPVYSGMRASANNAWGYNTGSMTFTKVPPKPIPEPTSGILLLMGMAMLGLRRKCLLE